MTKKTVKCLHAGDADWWVSNLRKSLRELTPSTPATEPDMVMVSGPWDGMEGEMHCQGCGKSKQDTDREGHWNNCWFFKAALDGKE